MRSNPDDASTFVFQNDFAALFPDAASPGRSRADGRFTAAEATGEYRASPRRLRAVSLRDVPARARRTF